MSVGQKEKIKTLKEEILASENKDIINSFQCSANQQVEDFLKKEAYSLSEKNLVKTRLFFCEENNLIGFYSLFNDSLSMAKSKIKELDLQLPINIKSIPAIRLHYIGVDDRYRDQKHGQYIMMSAIVNSAMIAMISGCPLIVLESTEDVKSFYVKFGFKHISKTSCAKYSIMVMPTKSMIDLIQKNK